jgi:type II secretory pathway pseudopilin PulG
MEILISITIATIVTSAAVGALLLTTASNSRNRATELATQYQQELMNNLRSVAESNWSQIYNLNKGTGSMYYLATFQQLPGTFNVTFNSPTITANSTSTNFNTSLVAATSGYAGDNILINSLPFTVSVINGTSTLTLNTSYSGTSTTALLYRNFSIRTGVETITTNKITFSRWFSIQNIFRDTCGTGAISTATATACTVATSTGNLTGILQDPSTLQVTVNITWSTGQAQGSYVVSQNISRTSDQVIRFNDWSGGLIANSSTVFTQPTNQYSSTTGSIVTSPGVLQLSQ